jgi:formylglycine-generating enzyme
MSDAAPRCCAGRRRDDDAAIGAPPATNPTKGFPARKRPVSFAWCAIPPGRFRMGSDDPEGFAEDGEGPARTVAMSGFEIAAYTVTNAQFAEFIRMTGFVTEAERYNWSFVFRGSVPEVLKRRIPRAPAQTPWWLPVPHAYWAQPEGPGSTILDRLDHPVVHVSWNDAQAYCRWARVRLPSEAQWEYAARGGLDGRAFPWGDELTPAGEHRCNVWQGDFPIRNTGEDGHLGTAPVSAYAPNGFGLYNVAGNVWEWCSDHFSPGYHRETSQADPAFVEPMPAHSLRGGSFLCHRSYCNRYRVAARSSNTPDTSASNIGFRVVRADEG